MKTGRLASYYYRSFEPFCSTCCGTPRPRPTFFHTNPNRFREVGSIFEGKAQYYALGMEPRDTFAVYPSALPTGYQSQTFPTRLIAYRDH